MSTRYLLVWRYFFVLITAQLVISLMNSLFVLSDHNATIALIALYAYNATAKRVLLYFICMEVVSLIVDMLRVAIWTPSITSSMLGASATLGVYYLVLIVFQWAIKIIVFILAIVLYRNWATLLALIEADQYANELKEETQYT